MSRGESSPPVPRNVQVLATADQQLRILQIQMRDLTATDPQVKDPQLTSLPNDGPRSAGPRERWTSRAADSSVTDSMALKHQMIPPSNDVYFFPKQDKYILSRKAITLPPTSAPSSTLQSTPASQILSDTITSYIHPSSNHVVCLSHPRPTVMIH